MPQLIDRLGLGEALKAKTTVSPTDTVTEQVAKGEIELGVVVITQIVTTPGVDLVGPLPPDIQYHITFAAGVSATSKAPDAARALIEFLTGSRRCTRHQGAGHGARPVARHAASSCHWRDRAGLVHWRDRAGRGAPRGGVAALQGWRSSGATPNLYLQLTKRNRCT